MSSWITESPSFFDRIVNVFLCGYAKPKGGTVVGSRASGESRASRAQGRTAHEAVQDHLFQKRTAEVGFSFNELKVAMEEEEARKNPKKKKEVDWDSESDEDNVDWLLQPFKEEEENEPENLTRDLRRESKISSANKQSNFSLKNLENNRSMKLSDVDEAKSKLDEVEEQAMLHSKGSHRRSNDTNRMSVQSTQSNFSLEFKAFMDDVKDFSS
eukprot:snap_masked-scaffold_41-processed-gene-1.15-mRNA-1 protein AED:1.00 eAED:1.00 QI:0/-1/0/0/-1/1/1/0/212